FFGPTGAGAFVCDASCFFGAGSCNEIQGRSNGGDRCLVVSLAIGSGAAAAIVSAIAGSTRTGGSDEVRTGSMVVPKRSVSSIVTFKKGVSIWGTVWSCT